MQGPLQATPEKLRNEGKADRRKTLHVGHTATVELVVDQRRGERWRLPGLSVNWNDVGVTGEDNASAGCVSVARRQRGEQIGFASLVVEGELRIDAVAQK